MSAKGASKGVRGRLPPGNCLDFNSFKSPFLTDFRKTVETGVDRRLLRIAGLEERTSSHGTINFHEDFRVNITSIFLPRSFSESCSFWYTLKDLFSLHKLIYPCLMSDDEVP